MEKTQKYKTPELLKLFRDLKPGPKAVYPSIDQIPSFQPMSKLERETQLLASAPSAVGAHEPLKLEKIGFSPFHCCMFFLTRAANLTASPSQGRRQPFRLCPY